MNGGVVEQQLIYDVIYHGSFRYFNHSLQYPESARVRLRSFREDHVNCAAGVGESPLGHGYSMAFAAEATCASVHLAVFPAQHLAERVLALQIAQAPRASPDTSG